MSDVIPFLRRRNSGVPLNEATLRLHSQRVDVPTYDRSALGRGVVHIGAGNFYRAHQAALFGDLAHQPRFVQAYGWALGSLHSKGARATLEDLVR